MKKNKELKLNVKITVAIIIALIIPIAIFAGVLFYYLEQNVVDTSIADMKHRREQSISTIQMCDDSINMATQFFLADTEMKDVLIKASKGETMTTAELIHFQESDITNLERLVSNNPMLYSVRIFADNDNVQEMMQILYRRSRMESLNWTKDENVTGWHFGYLDTAFSSLLTNQRDELACLVTPINDYQCGELGIIEASIKMSTLFPSIYENTDKQWGCVVDGGGKILYGNTTDEDEIELINEVIKTEFSDEEYIEYVKINGRKLVVADLFDKEYGTQLFFIRDITEDVHHIYFMRNSFVAMMIVIIIGLSFVVNMIVNRMLSQFYVIIKNIREIQHGNLDVRVENCASDEMGELGQQLNKMLDRIQQLMAENIGREVMVKDSEIRALQNQINAHFIYNVLESIKMMAEIDEEYEISDAITSLGKLLRYSMRWVSGNVSVAEELDYIKNYMALINLRYDFVINLSVNIPENIMEQEIPKMSLQPIVENAILHGIDPLGVDSTIYIKGASNGKDCIIEITDTGIGMNDEELKTLQGKIDGNVPTESEKGNGIGLHNVQNRIKMSFGEEYGMTISTKENCYTKVSICLPYRKREG